MLFALFQGPLELLVGGLELLRLSIELCVGLASTRWSGSRGKILPSLEALLQIALLVVLLALLCVVSLVCAPIFGAQGTRLRRSRLLMLCSMRFFLGNLVGHFGHFGERNFVLGGSIPLAKRECHLDFLHRILEILHSGRGLMTQVVLRLPLVWHRVQHDRGELTIAVRLDRLRRLRRISRMDDARELGNVASYRRGELQEGAHRLLRAEAQQGEVEFLLLGRVVREDCF